MKIFDQGFENGGQVPVRWHESYYEETPAGAAPFGEEETRALLLLALDGARDLKSVGRRVVTLAWLAGAMPELRDQKDLAKRLGVSQQRVSKVVGNMNLYRMRNKAPIVSES